jgi:hypothetical protein
MKPRLLATSHWGLANTSASSVGAAWVYAAGEVEIAPETEAEYDRNVMRVRFESN